MSFPTHVIENIENTKVVVRSSKWNKNIQYNCQKDYRTNDILQKKNYTENQRSTNNTEAPLKTEGRRKV